MMKRILFIINPISGTVRKSGIEGLIDEHLDKEHFDAQIVYTEYAGHAAELAAEAVNRGYDVVAAVGGDGTVNEVARSLVHSNTALAILPCGSGNGLARHLQIPMDIARAISIINKDCVHTLDYGRINGYPFFCTCGLGFDAFLSQKFAEAGKRGFITYIEKSLSDGLNYRPETYTITSIDANGQRTEMSQKAFLITCANATQFGNNAMIAPHASMKDGLLDIIIIEPFNTLESATIAVQLFSGTLPQNSHVKTFRANHVSIRRDGSGPVHCDGDPFNTGDEIDVELVEKSFNVVVNPDAHGHNENGLMIIGEYMQQWRRQAQSDIKRINKALLGRLRKI